MTAKLIFMVSSVELFFFVFILRSLDYIFTSNEYTPMKSFIPDYVGHMKLVNGQTITDHTVLDEAAIAEKRHLCVHVQPHE